MPIEPHELAAIKQAATIALIDSSRRLGIKDITAEAIAHEVLGAIDLAADDPTDPRPFAPGTKVRVKGTGILGSVVRTVETAGELHTVVVRLALDEGDVQPETPFGPRELEVLR